MSRAATASGGSEGAIDRKVHGWRVVGVAVVASLAAAVPPTPVPRVDTTVGALRVEVIATHPHDPEAFTQGLELHDGLLYESTGLYGRSDIRVTDLATGTVRQRVALPPDAFGEGLTVVGDVIWQLTWREGYAFRRDRATLAELDRVRYDGEGWGLCYDEGNDRLVMSDGTAELSFRDSETFDLLATVTVREDGRPLEMINELECVDGAVWANIWLTDRIVRIDPDRGIVEAVVDATGLLPEPDRADADVLNGIAAVPGTDTFLITGKLWPTVFLVRFVTA
jgi:glutaminyl-peptide cyclotransferase